MYNQRERTSNIGIDNVVGQLLSAFGSEAKKMQVPEVIVCTDDIQNLVKQNVSCNFFQRTPNKPEDIGFPDPQIFIYR